MERKNIASGTPWEAMVGYSRAVKVGPFVQVAGTTAVDKQGQVMARGDAYGQTVYILQKIEAALAQAEATLADVVRTRIFVTDITQWEAIGRAHGQFFEQVRPAATMVEVKGLITPELLVEIEVDAILAIAAE